jgi:glycosyltransferase involved in cell wall biosynthesis
MNLLTYVHLRNIYRSTGVGRVARELTEQLSRIDSIHQEILADSTDHASVVHKVGGPWEHFRYHLFQSDTSRQQMRWYLTNRPTAEDYWPQVDLAYCTAESYVPVQRSKLVVSCHDAQLFEAGAHRSSVWLLKQRAKWRMLYQRLAREADAFHMISAFAAERTAHFFPAIKNRLHVIPNAVSEAFFCPPTEAGMAVLDRLGVRDKQYIFVPGGLHYRKNADLILEAWPQIARLHPDLRLVVANHSDPLYLERAKALAPSLLLAGYQEEQPLVALYRSAQLVWFPTRYDGFGLPVIEAMACGTPVVSSNTTGIPEVSGGAAVLLSPDRPSDHVDAIDALLRNGNELSRYSAEGSKRASVFRWKDSACKLASLFASLL